MTKWGIYLFNFDCYQNQQEITKLEEAQHTDCILYLHDLKFKHE